MATFSYTNLPVVGTSTANEAANRIVASFTELATHINGKKVGTDNIEDGAITNGKLASIAGSEAVDTAQLKALAVTTAKVADGGITTVKLDQTGGSEAVTTATLRSNAVTPAKLAIAPFVEVVRTSSQSFPTTGEPGSPLTWEASNADTGIASGGASAMWSGSNPTRITVQRDGLYVVQAHVDYDNTTTNQGTVMHATLVKTNTSNGYKTILTRDWKRETSGYNSGTLMALSPNAVVNAVVGDYFELYLRQTGGTAKTIAVQTPGAGSTTTPAVLSPVLRACWIGKAT